MRASRAALQPWTHDEPRDRTDHRRTGGVEPAPNQAELDTVRQADRDPRRTRSLHSGQPRRRQRLRCAVRDAHVVPPRLHLLGLRLHRDKSPQHPGHAERLRRNRRRRWGTTRISCRSASKYLGSASVGKCHTHSSAVIVLLAARGIHRRLDHCLAFDDFSEPAPRIAAGHALRPVVKPNCRREPSSTSGTVAGSDAVIACRSTVDNTRRTASREPNTSACGSTHAPSAHRSD